MNLLNTSLKINPENKVKFIDLFAGIGGFHLAFKNLNGQCVFASENNEAARNTYSLNHDMKNIIFDRDIEKINFDTIPDHDVLTAGFPCQPFSQAGHKKGFNDIRGTMFFYIVKILKIKKPKAFFLENVRHLLKHDDGKTFNKIKKTLTNELGYSFYHKIIKASDHGVPQNRPRLFMVGFKNDYKKTFTFPNVVPLKFTMSDVFKGNCLKKIGFTLRVGGRGSPITDRRNWDSYLVNSKIRRLTTKHGLKMQGFPENFKFEVSESQAMKQLGNSVAVPAIQATAEQIINYIFDDKSK